MGVFTFSLGELGRLTNHTLQDLQGPPSGPEAGPSGPEAGGDASPRAAEQPARKRAKAGESANGRSFARRCCPKTLPAKQRWEAISGVYQRVLGPYIDALRVSKGLFEAGGENELDQGWGVQSCFLFSIFQPSVCILFIIIVVVLQLFWLGFLLSYLLLLLVAVISSAIRCIGGTGAWRNFPRTHGFGSWKMT